jgi:hypothetical protein
MKRSGIIALAASVVLTILGIALGGDFHSLFELQLFFLIGLLAILLVAYLNTRHELRISGGRDRLCLQFVHILASCLVCMGLLLTLIALAKAAFCARRFSAPHSLGTFAVSLLPFLYCLAFAEIACPVLSRHFGCRVERAEHAASDTDSAPLS